MKAADDGSGDLVVRFHEAFGGRARGRLSLSAPAATAVRCDLLERPTDTPEAVAGDGFPFELRPFELRTLRFTPA